MLRAGLISQGTQASFQSLLVRFPSTADHALASSLSPKEAVTAEGHGEPMLSGVGVTELD